VPQGVAPGPPTWPQSMKRSPTTRS
jgi:hypothetical protein